METTYVVFLNGYLAPAALYNSVVAHVRERVDWLPKGVVTTLKELCHPAFWNALSRGEKHIAGRIVAFLAGHGGLELELVGCRHRLPKRYKHR